MFILLICCLSLVLTPRPMSTFISRNKSQLPEYSLVPGLTKLSKRLKASFGIVIDTVQRIPNRLVAFLRRVRNHRIKAGMATIKKVLALFREVVLIKSFFAITALIKTGYVIGERGRTIYIQEIPASSVLLLKAIKNAVMASTLTIPCFYNTSVGRLWGLKCDPWDKLMNHTCPLGYTAN